jgi:hypothetical protein
MLTGGIMPEYLFRRTGGIVGLLGCLIEEACMAAMDTGEERLTQELLDEVDIDLSQIPNRDPEAGELPDVPAQPPRPKKTKKNRGRNTVFDDRGAQSAATS